MSGLVSMMYGETPEAESVILAHRSIKEREVLTTAAIKAEVMDQAIKDAINQERERMGD